MFSLWHFYVDETGNTGHDWLNLDQPVFVHGGWLVSSKLSATRLRGFDALRSLRGLGGTELKWSTLKRRTKGPLLVSSAICDAMNEGAIPVLWIMDKRYILACKIIETFMDPEYLTGIPAGLSSAFEYKQRLAERVYELDGHIQTFARWWSGRECPTPNSLATFARQLAEEMYSRKESLASTIIDSFTRPGLDAMIGEITSPAPGRSTTAHSVWPLFRAADGMARIIDKDVAVIHDESREFRDYLVVASRMFGYTFEPLRDAQGRTLFDGYEKLSSFRFADSTEDDWIQFSDLLCGFVKECTDTLLGDRDLNEFETATMGQMLAPRGPIPHVDWNAPEFVGHRLAKLGLNPNERAGTIRSQPS